MIFPLIHSANRRRMPQDLLYKKLESELGMQVILTAHCDVVVAVNGFQTPLMLFAFVLQVLAWLSIWSLAASCANAAHEDAVKNFFSKNEATGSNSAHTNNWAVLVCASRYWFNYRVRGPT